MASAVADLGDEGPGLHKDESFFSPPPCNTSNLKFLDLLLDPLLLRSNWRGTLD